MQCKYRDKLHLLILWKTYEAKSIVQYNRLITLQHGHSRRVRRMKNGGVWRRLAGSLLGTRQIYLCGAVRISDLEVGWENIPCHMFMMENGTIRLVAGDKFKRYFLIFEKI